MTQTQTLTLDDFRRSGPFYPLALTYAVALHGVKLLGVRGILDLSHIEVGDPTLDEIVDSAIEDNDELRAGFKKLQGALELRTTVSGGALVVPVEDTSLVLARNNGLILNTLVPVLGSILILAQDIVLAQLSETEQQAPLLQFLRHVRNAVGHNGRFDFRPHKTKQPKVARPAAWRQHALSVSMQGTLLFKDAAGNGLLSPGDPIVLLWDIEQAYPSLKV